MENQGHQPKKRAIKLGYKLEFIDMKRISVLIAAIMLSSAVVLGQKPKLGKVEGFIKANEIAEAKAMIDLAVDYEKTKDDPKTYHLRALVYTIIDTSSVHNGLADNARETALASYAKAEELSDPDKEPFLLGPNGFPVTMSQHIELYWAHFFNKGASAYGEQDFERSVAEFQVAQMIRPSDTNAYVNAGLAAQNAQDLAEARRNYQKAVDNGVKSKDILALLVSLISQDEEYELALEQLRVAREMYPTDNDLARTEISLLIQLNMVDEAFDGLKEQIAAEPDDPNLHFTLGILYEEYAGKVESEEEKAALMENAMAAYQAAVEVDDTYYNAHYNIGVILIARANEVIKQRNDLGVSREDLQKAEELGPVIDERLKAALPQWEKVRGLNANDIPTLETLSYLYQQLKMYDEQEEVMNRIEELGGSEEE